MRCLACYQPLKTDATSEYHPRCSRHFYGTITPPTIPYSKPDLDALVRQMIEQRITVPGVQPKMSLAPERKAARTRLTVVGLWGHYILKPSTDDYPALAENEHLTMYMARTAGLHTADHTLARLTDGALVYLSRRFDRPKTHVKIHQEDFCQLSERLTEDKYHSSLEQVARLVLKWCSYPGIDAARLWQLCLFCFLTGNADMHLKNFSLQYLPNQTIQLSPAYDLLSTHLAHPVDRDETALTLNGKRRKLTSDDFMQLADRLQLDAKAQQKILTALQCSLPALHQLIDQSFLGTPLKQQYHTLLQTRASVFWSDTATQ